MNKKLKFLLLFVIIAMFAVACGNTDPMVCNICPDNGAGDDLFLSKVNDKEYTGSLMSTQYTYHFFL